jgi:hypothetical protein
VRALLPVGRHGAVATGARTHGKARPLPPRNPHPVLAPFEPREAEEVSRMTRPELISRLLQLSEALTFRFPPAWLRRQWTSRLRSLLLACLRQHRATEPAPP